MMSPWILWLGAAWARAGGGQNFGGGGGYSGGGHSSGGGGFSGGGGSGFSGGGGIPIGGSNPEIVIFFLIIVVVFKVIQAQQRAGQSTRSVHRPPAPPPVDLDRIRRTDPDFSRPLFLDYVRVVYTRGLEEHLHLDRLGGVIGPLARTKLASMPTGEVREVIIGAARLNLVNEGAETTIRVYFETNFTLDGKQLLSQEMWTFARPSGARSPGPKELRDLRCVNCGSALETRPDGRCVQCDTVLGEDRFPWVVRDILVVDRRPVPPLSLSPGGGMEVGTDLPTLTALDLRLSMDALARRHPDFDWARFRRQVIDIFSTIQRSWAEMSWENARPFETDFLYQSHRYWIERYRRDGLQNRMADLVVTDVKPVKVEVDTHVEAFTVRIYAKMKDWTEAQGGRVVSGSKTDDRIFSEYWTFVRSVNAKGGSDATHCPSCGAALDKIGETGVCGYCESRITTGDYDWVLSGIEQDEAYRG